MGIREDLKIPLTMLSIKFLDELPYKGSYNGKRFLFKKNVSDDKSELKVYVWKDLYSFENTNEEDMSIRTFDYTKDGISNGLDFVEETSV